MAGPYAEYSLFFILAFSVYPLLVRNYINRLDYKRFVFIFTLFNAVGAIVVAYLLGSTFSFTIPFLFIIAFLGFLNVLGFYCSFYAYENERASIVLPIVASQFLFISLISGLLRQGLAISTVVSLPLLFVGILLVSRKRDNRMNRALPLAVAAAVTAMLAWSLMWVLFGYLLGQAQPLGNYALLALFSFAWSALATMLLVSKVKNTKMKRVIARGSEHAIAPGLLNGAGTVIFSAAFAVSSVETPLLALASSPIAIILAIAILKERANKYEIAGIVVILATLAIVAFGAKL